MIKKNRLLTINNTRYQCLNTISLRTTLMQDAPRACLTCPDLRQHQSQFYRHKKTGREDRFFAMLRAYAEASSLMCWFRRLL